MKKQAIRLLEKLLGPEKFDYWAWEETPYPCGSPLWSQIWWGYKWALLPKGWAGKSPSTKVDERADRRWREKRKAERS